MTAAPTTTTTRRPRPVLPLVVATTAAIFLLLMSVPNIAPSIRAAQADGTPGTFTAGRPECVQHFGHESCSWSGAFRPASGGPERAVTLHGAGRTALRPGQRVAAVDVGRTRKVYAGPSREWVFTGALLLAGGALLFPLGRRAAARIRTRTEPGDRAAG
jgi:hypothetical protein